MAKAKKLPSGNWRTQIYHQGVTKSFTAPTKKESELMALEWLNGKKTEQVYKTVGQCIDEYIASKENILSPTTIQGYRQVHKNDLYKLDNVCVDDLTQLQVQKLVNELSLRKSAKSVKNAHGLLSAVLNVFAPDLRLRTTLPQESKKIKHLPTVEQVIDAVIGSDVELPCLMALWLGMRRSEIRGAKRTDIKDGVLYIHQTIVTVEREDVVKDKTKTYDSTRMITLPPYILKLISALPPEQEYLTLLSGSEIYKHFVKQLKAHDVPHMSFHDLRHLNASTMLALGVPDKYAMERGGWSTTNIMKSVYQHTLTDERKKVDSLIDTYFDEIVKDFTQNFTQENENNAE